MNRLFRTINSTSLLFYQSMIKSDKNASDARTDVLAGSRSHGPCAGPKGRVPPTRQVGVRPFVTGA